MAYRKRSFRHKGKSRRYGKKRGRGGYRKTGRNYYMSRGGIRL